MSRVEFEYKPNVIDFRCYSLKRYSSIKIIRLYYMIILILLAIGMLCRIFEVTAYKDTINMIIAICIFCLLLPFVIILISDSVCFGRFKKLGKIAFFFDENGYGLRGLDFEIFYNWEAFKEIVETDDYMFFYMKNGQGVTIFKQLIARENLDSIHEIIKNTSIPLKVH